MFTTLVVPLDGSEFAWTYDRVHAAAHRLAGTVPVDAEVIVDPQPTDTLLAIADDRANALCFATHDRLPVVARLTHAVGSEFMMRARHPFVVVGTHVHPNGASDVVVALDGVDDPHPLLSVAVAWSQRLGARLRIVTVYEPVPDDLRRPDHFTRHHGPPTAPERYLAETQREAEALGAARLCTAPIADPVSAADGLVDHLANQPARLLVVGHRDRARHLGGGVLRNVLDRVAVPVLVVNRRPKVSES